MIYETIANCSDTVFILKDNTLVKCIVMNIVVKQYTIDNIIIEYKLRLSGGKVFPEFFDEHRVFLTKEELVNDLLTDESIEEIT